MKNTIGIYFLVILMVFLEIKWSVVFAWIVINKFRSSHG